MNYKIYYLRDMSGPFDRQFKKVELDELFFKDRDNLFQSAEEAYLYIKTIKEPIGSRTFTILPYISMAD